MLRRAGLHALRTLLELAKDPGRWRSVNGIALAQELPAPMLEQVLLKLRRAGLVEARRGRKGGYRLSKPASAIAVGEVLRAVGAGINLTARPTASEPDNGEGPADGRAEQRVLYSMGRRLQAALEKELNALSIEELLFDLSSWQESLSNEGGVMLG